MFDEFSWLQISTFVLAVVSTTASVFTIGLLFYKLKKYETHLQKHEVEKASSSADVYFSYEATPKTYFSSEKVVLEIPIKIINQSARKLAILAVFIKFRPIINSERRTDFQFSNFNSLPDFDDTEIEQNCTLLNFRDIAYYPGSVWQTSLNGQALKRSFDLIDDKFVEKYPMVMAQIIIFGADAHYIDKTHSPKYDMAPLRMPWCDYMDTKHVEKYNFFDRLKEERYTDKEGWEIKKGERILINKDGTIDDSNTKKFEPLLRSVINSNIEIAIDVSKI